MPPDCSWRPRRKRSLRFFLSSAFFSSIRACVSSILPWTFSMSLRVWAFLLASAAYSFAMLSSWA